MSGMLSAPLRVVVNTKGVHINKALGRGLDQASAGIACDYCCYSFWALFPGTVPQSHIAKVGEVYLGKHVLKGFF